jgi:hypothetical protein
MTNQTQNLASRLTKRLFAYAAVAGAAAAAAPHAEAEIIATQVHTSIHYDYNLDLNHDGINDFQFHSYYFSVDGSVTVKPLIQGNRIVATSQSCRAGAAAALPLGAVIGPGKPFNANANCMALDEGGFYLGPWADVRDHYLGLAFVIDGQIHFGWARLGMKYFTCFGCIEWIEGYAYETIPGKPIIAGDTGQSTKASAQPATLGALAAGAPALNLWRKQQEEQEDEVTPASK